MKIKHKLLSDYQFLSSEKKIFLIKSGTIIEEYFYKVKNESISIDKEIVDANPEIFQIIDWKAEMLAYMKSQKFPTPSQFHKKLIPFIEEMVLSSIQQNSGPVSTIDEYKVRELDFKELDLDKRERRIRDKEEEIDIRLQRVEKRENEYKEDIKSLDKKEDELRNRSREITEKHLDLEDRLQYVNERERNLDRSLLETSKDIDVKYSELQSKIDEDLRKVSQREKDLDLLSKELKRKEEKILQKESDLEEIEKLLKVKIDEINLEEASLMKLDQEIKDWENLHWKMKRTHTPPSAIHDSISEDLKNRLGI